MPPTSSADRSHSGPDVPALQARLAPALAALTFPARRWQAVAEADLYGCDGVTRALLDRLPERTYGSFGDLVGVLAAVLSGRAAPAPAGLPVVPPTRVRRSGTGASGAPAPGSLAARRRPSRSPGSASRAI